MFFFLFVFLVFFMVFPGFAFLVCVCVFFFLILGLTIWYLLGNIFTFSRVLKQIPEKARFSWFYPYLGVSLT